MANTTKTPTDALVHAHSYLRKNGIDPHEFTAELITHGEERVLREVIHGVLHNHPMPLFHEAARAYVLHKYGVKVELREGRPDEVTWPHMVARGEVKRIR
jgi:hypothetical protein